jgi:hypothetical protein
VQICNNLVVDSQKNKLVVAKRCQFHVVVEYIIQKLAAKNVVTQIQGNEPVIKGSTKARVRRLYSVQHQRKI